MSKSKLLIIDVAALGYDFLALNHMPSWQGLVFRPLDTVFPAVTCTAQASFRTGLLPDKHGMASNGVFQRELNRPSFWEQSSLLVEGPRIWESWRAKGKRVGLLFWQQSLGEQADLILSPAPVHKHGGGMIQDCYSEPAGLYHSLANAVGRRFNLAHYWGPLASTKSGDWIASATAALLGDAQSSPELCLVYLPTLDYDLQRYGPADARSTRALKAALRQLERMLSAARANGYEVLIFGDYAIAPVTLEPAFPNRALCEAALLVTRSVKGMLYPDFHRSRAFAMVDHEIAHVYVGNPDDVAPTRRALEGMAGIGEILDRSGQIERGLDHPHSGELVLVAEEGAFFAYPWWRESRQAPDYAAHVDIHNKPGYDPCELFFGRFPWRTGQDPRRIKGSHGRTGPGRQVCWTATFDLGKPPSLLELSGATRHYLESSA